MNDTVAWCAFVASIISVAISIFAAWINKEKLRLDLYDRRYRIYESAVNLQAVLRSPASNNFFRGKLNDSGDLSKALLEFTKKSAEGQFLFSKDSEIAERLQLMSNDAHMIVGNYINGVTSRENAEATARFFDGLEPIRERMAPFLNFHSYSALPSFLDENSDEL